MEEELGSSRDRVEPLEQKTDAQGRDPDSKAIEPRASGSQSLFCNIGNTQSLPEATESPRFFTM